MDIGIASFIIFVLVLLSLVYLKRKKVEVRGITLMFKTKKFRENIISTAERHPKFWRIYFNFGVVTSFLLMIYGANFIINNALAIFLGAKSSGLALILPFPTSSFSIKPGLILVPIWYWIIGIAILIIPHELAHGIALALNRLKIKSLGTFLFLFVIPGAFVEPDEKQLKKARKLQKLQVYAAGSFSNLLVALVFILILHLTLFSLYIPNGIYYSFPGAEINKSVILEMKNLSTGFVELVTKNNTYLATQALLKKQENRSKILVYEDWPAIRANISGTLKRIDGKPIYTPQDLSKILSRHKPGDKVLIETSKGLYNISLANNSGRAYLGVVTYYNPFLDFLSPLSMRDYKIKFEGLSGVGDFILRLIGFIIMICIGVGVANMLPIKPLDGGFILETLAGRKVANIISIIFLFILVYSLVGPYLPTIF